MSSPSAPASEDSYPRTSTLAASSASPAPVEIQLQTPYETFVKSLHQSLTKSKIRGTARELKGIVAGHLAPKMAQNVRQLPPYPTVAQQTTEAKQVAQCGCGSC